VLVVDKTAIDCLNLIDEAVTFATLSHSSRWWAGEMIGTVKIIPFAVAGAVRDATVAVARTKAPLIRVAPYRIRKVGVVSTVLPGLATKVIEKTLTVTAERLKPAGAKIVAERRVAHEQAAIARRSRKCCARVPKSCLYSARLPLRTGATPFRQRSRRLAARSSISACRLIPAICSSWGRCAASRCSARLAARAPEGERL